MQITTSVPRFTLTFLRHLFACDRSFTICNFDKVDFLIICTVATHRRFMLSVRLTCSNEWSRDRATLQCCTVDRRHVHHSTLSHDQLRAASLIGRNAVMCCSSLLNDAHVGGRPCDIAMLHSHVTV